MAGILDSILKRLDLVRNENANIRQIYNNQMIFLKDMKHQMSEELSEQKENIKKLMEEKGFEKKPEKMNEYVEKIEMLQKQVNNMNELLLERNECQEMPTNFHNGDMDNGTFNEMFETINNIQNGISTLQDSEQSKSEKQDRMLDTMRNIQGDMTSLLQETELLEGDVMLAEDKLHEFKTDMTKQLSDKLADIPESISKSMKDSLQEIKQDIITKLENIESAIKSELENGNKKADEKLRERMEWIESEISKSSRLSRGYLRISIWFSGLILILMILQIFNLI